MDEASYLSVTWVSRSADDTRSLGARLGQAILSGGVQSPLFVALSGELGAGKTTLIGGILQAMGVQGTVRSPTYTLVEPYEHLGSNQDRVVYHMDLYRLSNPRELDMLAPRDMLTPGAVLLVEWADRAGHLLPARDIEVNLRYEEDVGSTASRYIDLRAHSPAGEGVLRIAQGVDRS